VETGMMKRRCKEYKGHNNVQDCWLVRWLVIYSFIIEPSVSVTQLYV